MKRVTNRSRSSKLDLHIGDPNQYNYWWCRYNAQGGVQVLCVKRAPRPPLVQLVEPPSTQQPGSKTGLPSPLPPAQKAATHPPIHMFFVGFFSIPNPPHISATLCWNFFTCQSYHSQLGDSKIGIWASLFLLSCLIPSYPKVHTRLRKFFLLMVACSSFDE